MVAERESGGAILLALPSEALQEIVAEAFRAHQAQRCRGDRIELSRSPLAQTTLVRDYLGVGVPDHLREQGVGVSDLLGWALEHRLRPQGELTYTDRRWEAYLALQKPYFECVTFERLAEQMAISVARVYELRVQALEMVVTFITSALQDHEHLKSWRQQKVIERFSGLSAAMQDVIGLLVTMNERLTMAQLQTAADHLDITPTVHQLLLDNWCERVGDQIRPHPVLSDVVPLAVPIETMQRWHNGIAHLWADDRPLIAIDHWLDGGEMEQAAIHLCTQYKRLVADGQIESVGERFERFSGNILTAETWIELQLLAGDTALATDNNRTAQKWYMNGLGTAVHHNMIAGQTAAHYRLGKANELTHIDDAILHFEQGLTLLTQLPVGQRSELLLMLPIGLAWIYIQEKADLDKAARCLEQAAALNPTPSHRWTAQYHNAHVGLCDRQGDIGQKIEHGRIAWLAALGTQEPQLIFSAGNNLGQTYIWDKQYEQGMYYLEEVLARCEAADYAAGIAKVHQNLGVCYFFQEAYPTAISYYKKAHDLYKTLGNVNGQAWACHDLAEAYAKMNDGSHTQKWITEGERLATDMVATDLLSHLSDLKQTYHYFFTQLSAREQEAIHFAHAKEGISNKQYRELTGVSARTAARDLDQLVDSGLLHKMGQGRGTRYVVVA